MSIYVSLYFTPRVNYPCCAKGMGMEDEIKELTVSKDIVIKHRISSVWGTAKNIMNEVETALNKSGKGVGYAGKMVTAELIENAIKYGSHSEAERGILFCMNFKNNKIVIEVSNRINNQDDYDNLVEHIDIINATDDIKGLYVDRLRVRMENQQKKTQLGLYRIAYEGEFNLAHEYENNVVTVIATREV